MSLKNKKYFSTLLAGWTTIGSEFESQQGQEFSLPMSSRNSHGCTVGITAGQRPYVEGSLSPGRAKNCHSSISSRLALGPAPPPIQQVPRALSRGKAARL
jgi:hypothetical protein